METKAFQVHAADNVATLLAEADAGATVAILGARSEAQTKVRIEAREQIELGHKLALRRIAAEEAVTKYGVTIGLALRTIEAGEWVHLHNCRSLLDQRSGSFDLQTGAPREDENA